MQIINQFITNDIVLVSNVALSLVLLGLTVRSMLRSARSQKQFADKFAQLQRDNSDLQDQIGRLHGVQNRHKDLLCKIGDHIEGVSILAPADFNVVRYSTGSVDSSEALINLDTMPVNGADFMSEDEYLAEHIDPEVMLPASSVVSGVSQKTALNGPAYDNPEDETDPLTRALKISRTAGQ